MQIIQGGVTSAKGFMAAGAMAGIKYENRADMALVYSTVPTVTAGTFTTNVVKAAPVIWDKKLIDDSCPIQAVVLNSGVANACTGELGEQNNKSMAELMANELGLQSNQVLTASTGVIGRQLPMERIKIGCNRLSEAKVEGTEAGTAAAKAIMTTDTYHKECAVTVSISGTTVTIGAMSKGSGMIHPNMATMLGVVTTDAVISKKMLQKAVSAIVKDTFNMISVDRDTSTNDSLLALANGCAKNKPIETEGSDYEQFFEGMLYVLKTLAKKMAADGEGATKLFECHVINAMNKEQAAILAKSVISSNLTKAMIYGNDANCGRVMCALGYSGVEFNPNLVDLTVAGKMEEEGELVTGGDLLLVKDGVAVNFDEETATKILSSKIVIVTADMKSNDAEATAWGCDLTYDYVKINADYRS